MTVITRILKYETSQSRAHTEGETALHRTDFVLEV